VHVAIDGGVARMLEMEALQGETAGFHDKKGQKWPSQCQPRPFYSLVGRTFVAHKGV